MDAGIIAKIKGFLRRLYGRWACNCTIYQMNAGTVPEEVKIPADVKTCRKNLCIWLSQSVDESDKSGVVHCWESTKLLRAWEREVQAEASKRVTELFGKNPTNAGITIDVSGPPEEDPEAGYAGKAFVEVEEPDAEWTEWVDWESGMCGEESS